jgi:hypothetical protein
LREIRARNTIILYDYQKYILLLQFSFCLGKNENSNPS